MKKMFAGIVIGILLTVSVNAAVQYTLTESPWKIVVDGQVVQDEKLPMLLMEPGYNYAPVAVFREICGKIGLGFEANAEAKEVRITTKQEVKVVSETVQTVEYVEPATIEVDGVKKALVSDVYKLLKAKGYNMKDSGKSNFTLYIYDPSDSLIFKDVPFSMHQYNGNGVGFIDYQFFTENIKPLIN